MKKTFKILLYLLLVVAMFFLILIVTATLNDYRPGKKTLVFGSDSPEILPEWTEMDLLIWNIGYCGLDEDMDFFYDGGSQVRTGEADVIKNLESVESLLEKNDTIEFFLLQEVDVNSHRSYRINEYDSIESALMDYWSAFGKNYDVFFVPVPFTNPMGSVESGLQTLSRPRPYEVARWSFPGNFAWPKSLFMLDRCFLVSRYKFRDGKEFVLVNTHNSAYDDGSLRKMQMEYLRDFLLEEYEKGNYIVTGGDWNQSPPGFVPQYDENVFDNLNYTEIPRDYLPREWTWAYDPKVPSNRRVTKPYEEGISPTTTIDFYLLSPNVEAVMVDCMDLGFEHSDHQPVRLKIKLKN